MSATDRESTPRATLESDLTAIVQDPDLGASAKLAVSRERLRLAMTPTRSARRAPRPHTGPGQPVSQVPLLDKVRRFPGAALIAETLEMWWLRHPMRSAVLIAGEASRALIRPVAQRHPFQLVLVALAAGAVLAWSRPWRWIVRPAFFAGLLPQLVSRVVAHLPIETWISMIVNLNQPAPADLAEGRARRP